MAVYLMQAVINSLCYETGEQGKVEESMREMAAIEALKSEKADKEVSLISYC